jgi:hypothetical protein
MTPDQVIRESLATNSNGVFFLGCFDSRVTVYAQQVRALNLVDAAISESYIGPESRIAIIGGGAAGITAAAALISTFPKCKISLFESEGQLMHLQHGSRDRFLHPNLYDWPIDGSRESFSRLPILRWKADIAENVADQIREQFEVIDRDRINIHMNCKVTGVLNAKHSGCTLMLPDRACTEVFDAVIIAVGFGYEHASTDAYRSYWERAFIPSAIRSSKPKNHLFISGNGDGGLVDFQMAIFNALSHEQICELVTNTDGMDDAKRVLIEIEGEAWSTSGSYDIEAAYRSKVLPVLPRNFLLRVREQLRVDVTVTLHTRDVQLFRKDTAVHNRFGSFLAIVADEIAPPHRVVTIVGKDFVGATPLVGDVSIEGQSSFIPEYRIFRFGADKETNLAPFREFADSCTANRVGGNLQGFRAATPSLNLSALQRFEATLGQSLEGIGQTAKVLEQSTNRAGNAGLNLTVADNIRAQSNSGVEDAFMHRAMPTAPEFTPDQELNEHPLAKENDNSDAEGDFPDQLGRFEPQLDEPVQTSGSKATNTVVTTTQRAKEPFSVGAGAYKPAYTGVTVKFGNMTVPNYVPILSQLSDSTTDLPSHPIAVNDLPERGLVSERAKHWVVELQGLLETHESSTAIKLMAEIDQWLQTNEMHVDSSLLAGLYEQLSRVALTEAQKDAADPANLDVTKARAYYKKAQNAAAK